MQVQTTRLLTIAQAQERLGGIGRTTLYAMFNRGDIRRIHIGRRAFADVASVDAYLDTIGTDPRN